MKLSVIIVNYNVRYFLELCLKSVQAAIQNLEAEIIVVDNNSPDDSCAMMATVFPEVRLIANKDNTGFATANNQGVRVAKGEYVCILNPDTVIAEDTFEKMLAFAKTAPKPGAIGAQLIDGTGKFLPECKRNLPSPRVAFQKIFGNGDLYYARHVKKNENGKVAILVGAYMFMKRDVYLEVGGFDEQYFMYGEDIDLSHTIILAGYENYYMGGAPVIHYKGESTSKDAVYRKRFYGAMRIFYDKHLKRNYLESLFVRVGLKFTMFTKSISGRSSSQKEINVVAPERYWLWSDNPVLENSLAAGLDKPLEVCDSLKHVVAGEEVLLDAETLGYKGCIDLIRTAENKELTFKIIPKSSTFALGSNSSDGRGALIKF